MKMETDDPVKSQLLQRSSQYREDLEDEVKEISDRTEKILTNALVIGGSLAVTYFLYSQLSGSSKKKRKLKKAKPTEAAAESAEEEVEETSGPAKIISQIGTALVSQASVFLLSMAKEKLSEYLEAQAEKKKHEHS